MGTSSPQITILILNWNGLKDTIECLESLQKQKYPNYEVIVVDNASKGNDVAVLKEKFGNFIRVIQNTSNLGFAEGNNVGIRTVLHEAKSRYIMFLNNDTVVEPDFLTNLVHRAEGDQTIGMVGPEIHYYDDRTKIHSRGGIISLYTGYRFVGGSEHKPPYDDDSRFTVRYYSGSAFLISCEVVRKVGLFDPQYFYYAEDVDLGYRVSQAGYRVVCEPSAHIYHKEAQSVGGNIRNPLTAYYETRNALLVVRKHGTARHMAVFLPFLLALTLKGLLSNFSSERRLLRSRLKGFFWHLTHRVVALPQASVSRVSSPQNLS